MLQSSPSPSPSRRCTSRVQVQVQVILVQVKSESKSEYLKLEYKSSTQVQKSTCTCTRVRVPSTSTPPLSPPIQNLQLWALWNQRYGAKPLDQSESRGAWFLYWGTFVPHEDRHMCAKFHDSSSNRAWDMLVQRFQLVAIAPPMGVSGSYQITLFLVPPYTPPPSFVWIGGFLLELCWWRTNKRTNGSNS